MAATDLLCFGITFGAIGAILVVDWVKPLAAASSKCIAAAIALAAVTVILLVSGPSYALTSAMAIGCQALWFWYIRGVPPKK